MASLFFSFTVLSAAFDWLAVARNWKRMEELFKPAVITFLLAWVWTATGRSLSQPHLIWFLIGLGFSLIGDICLLPSVDRFMGGLVAFLLAHLAYIIGLNTSPPPLNLAGGIILVLTALTALMVYQRIAVGLEKTKQNQLKIPVLLYTLVISGMVVSALWTLVKDSWSPWPAICLSAGALLFFLSDILLAWNKFVFPLKNGRMLVIVAYHLGQILIAVGASLPAIAG